MTKDLEKKLEILKINEEIARKMVDVLITKSEYLFNKTKRESNKLKHWWYFSKALKIQKKGINYLMKSGRYMDEYFKILKKFTSTPNS